MDTSNSTQKNRSIDVSTYIIGEEIIKKDSLIQDDWIHILKYVYGLLRPRLKYLSGHKTLKELVQYKIQFDSHSEGIQVIYNALSTKIALVEGINLKTRILGICKLPSKMSTRLHQYSKLLISDTDGRLFTVDAHYIRHSSREDIFEYEADSITINSVDFSSLTLAERYCEERETIGGMILDGMFRVLSDTIEKKRTTLDCLEEVLHPLESIRSRLSFCKSAQFIDRV